VNKSKFEATASRIKEINDVIGALDETIRAAAFAVLRPYADGDVAQGSVVNTEDRIDSSSGEDSSALLVEADEARDFLSDHHSDKPAENVKAIAALVYKRFGTSAFTAEEVRNIAHEAGITVPDRVDVTLGGARVEKKALFQKQKSGVYKPTVHGERYFKEKFGVSKGTGRRSDLS